MKTLFSVYLCCGLTLLTIDWYKTAFGNLPISVQLCNFCNRVFTKQTKNFQTSGTVSCILTIHSFWFPTFWDSDCNTSFFLSTRWEYSKSHHPIAWNFSKRIMNSEETQKDRKTCSLLRTHHNISTYILCLLASWVGHSLACYSAIFGQTTPPSATNAYFSLKFGNSFICTTDL